MRCFLRSVAAIALLVASEAHAGFAIEGDPAIAPSKVEKPNVTVTQMRGSTVSITPIIAAPAAKMVPSWEVKVSDVTLRKTLLRWAKQAGWQLSWEVKVDYPVQLEAIYLGSFDSAVEQYTAALRGSDYPLIACFYDGNRVVRVLHFGEMKSCDSQKEYK